ncbi:hypothetical protein V8C43DRAFT_33749 [Trichoderma afarasin]
MTNRKINFSASLTHPFSGLLCFSPLPVALLLPLAPHRWFRLLIHFLEHATQSRAAASFFSSLFFFFFFSFFFPPQNAMLKPGWFDGTKTHSIHENKPFSMALPLLGTNSPNFQAFLGHSRPLVLLRWAILGLKRDCAPPANMRT